MLDIVAIWLEYMPCDAKSLSLNPSMMVITQ